MATITISLAGSALTGLTSNPSKGYTISDADLTSLLAWASFAFNGYIQSTYNPSNTPGFTPTNAQILLAWIQHWVNSSKFGVQQYQMALPAPITIA